MKKTLILFAIVLLTLPSALFGATTSVPWLREPTNNTIWVPNILDKAGVGTTTPGYNLTVGGDINFTGNLYKNGSLFSSGTASPWNDNGGTGVILATTTRFVGIGTTTPIVKLHLVNGPGNIPGVALNGNQFIIQNNFNTSGSLGTAAMALIGGSASTGRYNFGDSSNTNISGLQYTYGSSRLGLYTNSSTEALSVLSNGNIGIGTTTPTGKLSVVGDQINQGNLFLGTDIVAPKSNAFGSGVHQVQFATSSNDITGMVLTNDSNGALAGTILNFSNNLSTKTGIGFSQRYGANIVYSGSNFNGSLVGANSLPANAMAIFTNDGSLIYGVATSSALAFHDWYIGGTTFFDGAPDMRLNQSGNLSIALGTGTAAARLHVNTAPTNNTSVIGQYIVNRGTGNNAGATLRIGYNTGAASTGGVTGRYNTTLANPVLALDAGGTEFLTGTSDGNVGIGSTTPRSTLAVVGMSGVNSPNFSVSSSSPTIPYQFVVQPSGNVGIGSSTPGALLTVNGSAGTTDHFTVASSSGASEFTVNGNGNVGIGIANPTKKFEVRVPDTGAASAGGFAFGIDNFATKSYLEMLQGQTLYLAINRDANSNFSSSTLGWAGAVITGSPGSSAIAFYSSPTASGAPEVARFNSNLRMGIGTNGPQAMLEVRGNLGIAANATAPLQVWATSTGATLGTFTATGRLGLGTTSPVSTLGVDGTITNVNQATVSVGAVAECVQANGAFTKGTGSDCTASDARLKTNFNDLKLGLSTLKKFKPLTFDMKENGEPRIGFTAQDMDSLDNSGENNTSRFAYYYQPGTENEGTPSDIDLDAILAVTVKSVQELSDKVDAIDPNSTKRDEHGYLWLAIAILAIGLGLQQVQIIKLRK